MYSSRQVEGQKARWSALDGDATSGVAAAPNMRLNDAVRMVRTRFFRSTSSVFSAWCWHELALVIAGSGFGMHKSKTKTASRRGVASARSGAQDSWAVQADEWGDMGGAGGGWACIVGACE
jgi:hypothetical protein